MAQKEEIFVGLDIGSSKITTVIGKREGGDHLSVIGVGTSHLTGLKKGVVTEIEDTVSGISESVEIAERMAGVDVSSASVNLNGPSISSQNSSGVAVVGRADHKIVEEDVARAEEAACAIQISPNKEIIHSFPRFFKIDDQEGIKDPVGMTGIRLESEVHLVTVGIQHNNNLKKVVSQAGIGIDDLVVSPIAAAKAVTKKRQRDLGCVLVDIGAETTGICVFEEGEIFYTDVLPIGGAHITNDIAIGLRTAIDIAEKVKIKYGHAYKKGVSEKKKVDLSEIDIKEEGVVSVRQIAEIIEARVEEIFKMVRDKLKEIERDSLLPAGVIITGGTARLKGIDEKAKEVTKLPAEIAKPHNLLGFTDKVYDPAFSVAVGLMLYNFEESSISQKKKPIVEVVESAKRILKNILP